MMLFLDDFMGYDTSLDANLLPVGDTTKIELTNGTFDEVFVDKNLNREYTTKIPDWGYDTVLDAKFHNNLLGGNIEFTLDSISHLVLKQRKYGDYNWVTLAKIPINKEEDLNVFYNNKLPASNTTYEYQIVPIVNGVEGIPQTVTTDIKFDGAFIMDDTYTYQIILNLQKDSLTRNNPSSIVTPQKSKYPYVVYTSQSVYDTISISGTFIELNRETCEFEVANGHSYRKKIRDFLTNQKPKLLKLWNGEIYLGNVTDSIAETDDGHTDNVITKFIFTETGDTDSNADLYYHGFIDYLGE